MPKHLGIPELLKFSVADFKMKLAIVIIALIGATLASPQDAPQPAAERTASPQDKPQIASESQDEPQSASERGNDSE